MRLRILMAALAVCLLLPAASAHETLTTSDSKYRVVIGQLSEPVVTYAKTGLDICFTDNSEARTPVTPDVVQLTATLTSPSGETMSQALRSQFGRAGCYQFTSSYILTEAGQYTVDLSGDLLGTAIDFQAVNAGGAVTAMEDITFPDEHVSTNAGLAAADAAALAAIEARAAALDSEIAALKTRITELEESHDEDAPFPAAVPIGALLVVLVALRRRDA